MGKKILLEAGEILKQSEAVFKQFGESKWKPFAEKNSKLERGSMEEIRNSGIGKFMLLVAMGQSLEENIDVIKKYRDRVTITTNDKNFGKLLERGVKADYVMICDCNVLYKHLEPYIEETKDVAMIGTPYANVEWTEAWKGKRYFYVNRDAISSETIFKKYFGEDVRTIPAGSNVSNAMFVFWNGADEKQNVNWGGFEQYILVGYDYSWRPGYAGGHYYAWDDAKPKRYYMNHHTMLDFWKNPVFTSQNLMFSAKWMQSYINAHGLPVINCSMRGLLEIPYAPLEAVLSAINPDPKGSLNVRRAFDVAKSANLTFEGAKVLFDKSREELLCREQVLKKP